MKIVSYLLLFFMTVLVGNAVAQNPTILTGNYITNVFGQSNFIKNPNAQINTLNITVSGGGSPTASVTRSTTTPLVATTEFLVGVSSANGTITWDTRAFDSGMKNQNCEARFSYRGFQSTSKAHIKQGANTVATLNLSATGTDPRIASINFPCGDLSSATTFVITDTSTLGGTNEIGGIYVGLATNQANVAQAELAGATELTACASNFAVSASSFTAYPAVASCVINNFGSATTTTKDLSVTIPNAKPGWYYINANIIPFTNVANSSCFWTIREDTSGYISGTAYANPLSASSLGASQLSAAYNVTTTSTRTWRVVAKSSIGAACQVDPNPINGVPIIQVFRFPTSSELVVTPERQNVFAAARFTNANVSIHNGSAAPTGYGVVSSANFSTFVARLGKAAAPLSSGCFGGVPCSANDLGFSVPNMPVGTYSVRLNGFFNALASASATECSFQILEATTGTSVAKQVHVDNLLTGLNNREFNTSFAGAYSNSSVATRNFIVRAEKAAGGTAASCQIIAGTATDIYLELIPLDQPSNSALYVQGPVKAAGTGNAIPAGYVGESKSANIATTNITGSVYNNLQTLTLTPGVWLCSTQSRIWRNAATLNANFEFLTCLGASGSASCTPSYTQVVSGSSYTALPTTFNYVTLSSVPVVIRYDGTTLYWADGNTSSSTTGEIFQKVYLDTVSGTPQASGRIDCTRLN